MYYIVNLFVFLIAFISFPTLSPRPANTRGAVLPYAQLQILMRQVDGGGNKWSLSLGGGLTLRRLGKYVDLCRARW